MAARAPAANSVDKSGTMDDDDVHYLHHGNFVNHSLNSFLQSMSSDPETRRRHADIVKKMSPPRDVDPKHSTAYERYWYAKQKEIIDKLEGKSPSPARGAAAGGGNSPSPSAGSGVKICDKCHGSIPPSRFGQTPEYVRSGTTALASQQHQQQQQQQLGTAGTNNNNNNSPPKALNNSNVSGVSQARSSASRDRSTSRAHSLSAMPGTDPEFEPLHPSHLYLHHNDMAQHQLEGLVAQPSETGLRQVKAILSKAPPRDQWKTLTAYSQWWYEEASRIEAYLEDKKAAGEF